MKNMNEQGRSMVEMLGVLAIIGVLSAGGLAGYSKAMFKHKLNNTIDQITMMVTNVRTLYGTQGDYKGLTNKMAIDAGIVPTAMATGGDVITNPFKGQVYFGTGVVKSGNGYADTAFLIKLDGLPSEACVQIATSDWGNGAGTGFIGVKAESVTTPVQNASADILNWIIPEAYAEGDAGGTGETGTGGTGSTASSLDFNTYVGTDKEGVPLSLSDAIQACAGTGTTNAVTLKFY